MTFQARRNGQWVGGDDQSAGTVVYGRSGGAWQYAKSAWARRNGVWQRAWTDCRQHDAAGGRDWSSETSTSTVTCTQNDCQSCGTSTKTVTTVTYTKDGCPTYTRTSETSCTSCGTWTAATSTFSEGGFTYTYVGPAGYFEVDDSFSASDPPGCGVCDAGCFRGATYFVENCSVGGRRGTTTPISCGTCLNAFGDPC